MPAKSPDYHKQHYAANKEKYKEQSKLSRQRKREWYLGIMSKEKCQHCGENDPVVLDWHHTDPSIKEASVSWLLQNRSRKAILEEIDKCICLCANCHRRAHHGV